MKNTIKLLPIIAGLFIFTSCSKSESTTSPLTADFEITVTGEAPNAQISIKNLTTTTSGGTLRYEWTFGKGASTGGSVLASPPVFTCDKTGELEITLFAYDSKGNDKTVTKKVTITGVNGLLELKNMPLHNTFYTMFFAMNGEQAYAWRHNNAGFNTTLSDITANPNYTDPNVLVPYVIFGVKLGAPNQIMSPDDAWSKIPNGNKTKIKNNIASTEMTIQEFDDMKSETKLKSLTIESDNIGYSAPYPKIILFEMSNGKKGAMKVSQSGSEYVYDIKLIRY